MEEASLTNNRYRIDFNEVFSFNAFAIKSASSSPMDFRKRLCFWRVSQRKQPRKIRFTCLQRCFNYYPYFWFSIPFPHCPYRILFTAFAFNPRMESINSVLSSVPLKDNACFTGIVLSSVWFRSNDVYNPGTNQHV